MPKRAMPISAADKERQQTVLRDLRKAAGLSPTTAAGLIGVSYSQLLRYEEGETILPTNYFAAVARSYGVSKSELSRRLGLVDDAMPPDGPLDQMLTAIGMPEDERRQLLSSIGNDPTTAEERAAIVEFVGQVLRKRPAVPERARIRA